MFERYTEKARRVIFFARYEAGQFGAQAIEAEHILLGLLREDKQLPQLLFSTPHSAIEAIRKAIEATDPLREKVSASVDMPLSAAAKRVLSYAVDESDRLGDRHIGTEHLLLGILREDRSLAAEVLADFGVTAEKVVGVVTEAASTLREAAPLSEAMRMEPSASGTVLPEITLVQFFQQFKALIQILIERGISPEESFQGFDWSPMHWTFTALLDMLVSKGIIGAEEKQRIVDPKV